MSCSAQVSKSASSRLPDGDQLTIQLGPRLPRTSSTSGKNDAKTYHRFLLHAWYYTKYTCELLSCVLSM